MGGGISIGPSGTVFERDSRCWGAGCMRGRSGLEGRQKFGSSVAVFLLTHLGLVLELWRETPNLACGHVKNGPVRCAPLQKQVPCSSVQLARVGPMRPRSRANAHLKVTMEGESRCPPTCIEPVTISICFFKFATLCHAAFFVRTTLVHLVFLR